VPNDKMRKNKFEADISIQNWIQQTGKLQQRNVYDEKFTAQKFYLVFEG
jgi:hypothetical protein